MGHRAKESFPYVGQRRRVFIREGDKPHIVRGAKPFEFQGRSFRITITPADPKTMLAAISAAVRTTPRELNDNGAAHFCRAKWGPSSAWTQMTGPTPR